MNHFEMLPYTAGLFFGIIIGLLICKSFFNDK